jgi:hypothetical protein
VPIVLKSGSLILLELSWPLQVCNGIALPFQNGWIDSPFVLLLVTDSKEMSYPKIVGNYIENLILNILYWIETSSVV